MTQDLQSIAPANRIRWKMTASSKKRILDDLAKLISEDQPCLDSVDVFRKLIEREKLGSTGIGHGVAIPHCRVPNCTGIIGYLLTLDEAIDFESIDREPVDILFALVVPEEANDQHLQTLALVAEKLGNDEIRQKIRACDSQQALETLIKTF